MKYGILTFILLITLAACRKEEGVGGDASIKGQLWTYAVNSSFAGTIADTAQAYAQYAAEDTYVYIVYGDHSGFDKRIKTDYNGYFEFSFLYPGDYTIYAYSFDPLEIDTQSPVIKKVHIEERKESIDLGRIGILSQP